MKKSFFWKKIDRKTKHEKQPGKNEMLIILTSTMMFVVFFIAGTAVYDPTISDAAPMEAMGKDLRWLMGTVHNYVTSLE